LLVGRMAFRCGSQCQGPDLARLAVSMTDQGRGVGVGLLQDASVARSQLQTRLASVFADPPDRQPQRASNCGSVSSVAGATRCGCCARRARWPPARLLIGVDLARCRLKVRRSGLKCGFGVECGDQPDAARRAPACQFGQAVTRKVIEP